MSDPAQNNDQQSQPTQESQSNPPLEGGSFENPNIPHTQNRVEHETVPPIPTPQPNPVATEDFNQSLDTSTRTDVENTPIIPDNPVSPENLTNTQPVGFAAASMQQTTPETPPIPPKPPKLATLKEQGKKSQKLIFIVVVLLIVTVFAALGYFIYSYLINKRPPTKEITLTYWGLWESKENIQPIIDAYQKENPNVTINYEERSPEYYFETLLSRLGKETGPDIVRIHNSWVGPLTVKLTPVPATIYDEATYEKTFYEVVQNTLQVNGSYYGLPLEFDGLALVYNESLFTAAGIKDPPKTWEEFRETAKKLTKYEEVEEAGVKVTKMTQAGAAFGYSHNVDHFSDILGLLMAQNGVQFVDETGIVAFDKTISPDGRNLGAEALTFYSLFAKGDDIVWNKDWVSAYDAFVSGKLAMMFAPSWRVLSILEANKNLKVKVAVVPQIPLSEDETTDINWGTYWVEAVSKTAKDQATAWDFLKFMTEKEQMVKIFTLAGEKRIFGEPYSRQDLYSTLSSDPYLASYVESADTATSWSMCSRTYDAVFNDEIIVSFAKAVETVNNGGSAETAIKQAALEAKTVYTNLQKK